MCWPRVKIKRFFSPFSQYFFLRERKNIHFIFRRVKKLSVYIRIKICVICSRSRLLYLIFHLYISKSICNILISTSFFNLPRLNRLRSLSTFSSFSSYIFIFLDQWRGYRRINEKKLEERSVPGFHRLYAFFKRKVFREGGGRN